MPLSTDVVARFERLGYSCVRAVPGQGWCGLARQMFTTGLFVGITADEYKRRYCFETWAQAEAALRGWSGRGDPPGPWIKEKPSERIGPGLLEEE